MTSPTAPLVLPSKDELDLFVNALQLCIKSRIIHCGMENVEPPPLIHIQFEKKPSDDEAWEFFERLTEGTWEIFKKTALYSFDKVSEIVSPLVINFLFITRLQRANIEKFAEIDPQYKSITKKIMGESIQENLEMQKIENLGQAVSVIMNRLSQKHMTIRELAESSRLSMVSISNFKSGKDIRLSNFIRIAAALGLKLKIQ